MRDSATRNWFGRLAAAFVLAAQAGLLTHGAEPAPPTNAPVPVIQVTDLFRPHNDPDDHWDLACAYALARSGAYDLRAVLIDFPPQSWRAPDLVAVSQMNQIAGRAVPVLVGSPRPMAAAEAARAENRPALAGIHAFLQLLRDSPRPVVIQVLGSCRDLAIAARLDPGLFARQCAAVYLNAGSGTRDPAKAKALEYNVNLDPVSYAAVFELPCPVYWLPCFEEVPTAAQPEFCEGEHGSFYRFRQGEILPHLSDRVQNYFAYMFRHGRPGPDAPAKPVDTTDWLNHLLGPRDAPVLDWQNTVDRNMWCTAGFLHAAGRTVEADGGIVPLARARNPVFTFDPIRIECSPNGVTRWTDAPEAHSRHILHVRDRAHYAESMTRAMKALLTELP